MKRREFLQLAGLGAGATVLQSIPSFGHNIQIEKSLIPLEVSIKKNLADIALNAAKSKGATYIDVRLGRYLNQFITTRETRVDNIANTESFGMGIRVIANGSWGFAATDNLTPENIAKTAALAVQMAKVNSKLITEPVVLASQKGYGEVSWKTPIEKNGFDIPLKEKIDLLLNVNNIALANGSNFVTSQLFLVNEIFCLLRWILYRPRYPPDMANLHFNENR